MYKNILVAVALDHPSQANEALKLARELADDGADTTALHVVEEIPPYAENHVPPELLANRRPQAMAELKAELGDATDVKPVVVQGHAGRTIVDFAEDQEIDCIVIASHKPGLQDYFLGSTAHRVVRHAQCAVHVLR